MTRIRVGVPPGVGDCYWALTKLKAFAAGRRVTLCIQGSQYDRALEWQKMVDFIDEAEIVRFEPGHAEHTGYSENAMGLDFILWPNAIIDRGERIEAWLPELATDLSFPVQTPDMGPPRTVVYASSVSINERWMSRGPDFWLRVIRDLAAHYGPVTLVGAAWDQEFRDRLIGVEVEDLVGKTTLPQLAGIIRNARVVAGVICGVTILANHFRTPCVALWPDWKFPANFPHAWVTPDAPYVALPASALHGGQVLMAARSIAP